jgi:hypothetical protein
MAAIIISGFAYYGRRHVAGGSMILLELVILIFAVILLLLFITQIFVPLLTGRAFFPHFRRKTLLEEEVEKARSELDELKDLVELKKTLANINREKAELEKK